MKCPKCQTTNGKTNKYCRECGAQLVVLDEQTALQEAHVQEALACAVDDVALGEELFGIWKLYEAGDLDIAVGSLERIIERSPDSASAHSILALIYERKADSESAAGSSESARGFLQKALREYERIIDLNPDSGADREKLVYLRKKLAGQVVLPASAPVVSKVKAQLVTSLKNMPPQILAAAGAFVIIMVLATVLLSGPSEKNDEPKPLHSQNAEHKKITVISTPNSANQQSNSQNMSGTNSTGFNVYTYPTPAAVPPPPVSIVSPAMQEPAVNSEVSPMKLPPIGSELTLVPESKTDAGNAKPQPKADKNQGNAVKSKVPAVTVVQPDTAASGPDGASLLAKAIELGNEERYQDAISSAQQSVAAFQEDIASGKNATAAQRGIENAGKYIQLWRQSSGGAE